MTILKLERWMKALLGGLGLIALWVMLIDFYYLGEIIWRQHSIEINRVIHKIVLSF